MTRLTRRKLLRGGALGSASLIFEHATPSHSAVRAMLWDGLFDPPEPTSYFDDRFHQQTLARKPAYSIVADTNGALVWMHTPSIIEGRDGVLIAVWSNNGAGGDEDSGNVIVSSRSLDQGLTWSEQTVVCPPSAINPVFLRAHNGDLVVLFDANHSLHQDDCSVAFRRSADNGTTWSETRPVELGARVVIIANNGLVLPNGDWLISFHYDRSQQGGPFSIERADYVAAVAISKDEGTTWTRHGAIEILNETHFPNANSFAVEPAVTLRQDGSLLMVIRTRNGRLYQATSPDHGVTWSAASPMVFSNDDSKPSVLTLRNGHIVLFWNNTRILDFASRYPLMATLSTDGGATWSRSIMLEDDNVTLDYPTAVQSGELIKVVYGYNRQQIRCLSLTEEDFRTWVPINRAGAWKILEDRLQFAGAPEIDNALNWLRWSKAVAFLASKRKSFVVEVDLLLDEAPLPDMAIGVFPAYQDESNWTAWVWEPALRRAGLQKEAHWGNMAGPAYARNRSEYFFDTIAAAQVKHWYTLRLQVEPEQIEYQIVDRESKEVLGSGFNQIAWEGQFIAIGSRRIAASFDNIVLRRRS